MKRQGMTLAFNFNNGDDFIQEFEVQHDISSPICMWIKYHEDSDGCKEDVTITLRYDEAIVLAKAILHVAEHIKENYSEE